PGWHFHFLSADRSRGGHVLGLTTGEGLALLEEFSDLRISLPERAPASSAGVDAIKAVERPQGLRTLGRALARRPKPAAAAGQSARANAPTPFHFAPHRKSGPAAIPLLSAIARLDISSPREPGVRFAHGVAMSSQKNGAAILDKTKAYRPSDKEPFMNERQREYFRQKLLTWKEEILKEAKETLAHLQAENENHPD